MNRYTNKMLQTDAANLNKILEKIGSDLRFVVGSRYNYSAVDLATPEQLAQHHCQRNLETGTPRECLAACHSFISGETIRLLNRQPASERRAS